jgi:hypothetical protein
MNYRVELSSMRILAEFPDDRHGASQGLPWHWRPASRSGFEADWIQSLMSRFGVAGPDRPPTEQLCGMDETPPPAMSWLFFVCYGPVLWALSVHIDKYLVERYFKGHRHFDPYDIRSHVRAPDAARALGAASRRGLRSTLLTPARSPRPVSCTWGALFFYLQALKLRKPSSLPPSSKPLHYLVTL